jgi:hypothetical protein
MYILEFRQGFSDRQWMQKECGLPPIGDFSRESQSPRWTVISATKAGIVDGGWRRHGEQEKKFTGVLSGLKRPWYARMYPNERLGGLLLYDLPAAGDRGSNRGLKGRGTGDRKRGSGPGATPGPTWGLQHIKIAGTRAPKSVGIISFCGFAASRGGERTARSNAAYLGDEQRVQRADTYSVLYADGAVDGTGGPDVGVVGEPYGVWDGVVGLDVLQRASRVLLEWKPDQYLHGGGEHCEPSDGGGYGQGFGQQHGVCAGNRDTGGGNGASHPDRDADTDSGQLDHVYG